MNDFDYENLQKKRLAKNAKYKKGGSRSKKCTLPGDSLSAAEKARLSQTLVSVNLKAPLKLAEFKKLPPELKREYIEYLRDEYKATSSMISHELFNRSTAYLSCYTATEAPELKGVFSSARRPRLTKSERRRWLEFVGHPDLDDLKSIKPYKEDPEPEPEIEPVSATRYYQSYRPRTEELTEPEPVQKKGGQPVKKAYLTKVAATYEGPLTAEDLVAVMSDLLGDRSCKSITFDITF